MAATQGVGDVEQGPAGGLVNMGLQVGAAIGVAVAAAVIGTGAASGGSIAPDRSALLVVAASALLATLIALRAIGAPMPQPGARSRETIRGRGAREGRARRARGAAPRTHADRLVRVVQQA